MFSGDHAGDSGEPFRRLLPHASGPDLAAWGRVEPRHLALTHAAALFGAGVSPADAEDLFRILDDEVCENLSALINAGRMADIDTEHILLWAASGLLRPERPEDRPSTGRRQRRSRRRALVFTTWVTVARRFINATQGDQSLAALCAAARLSPEETAARFADGTLDIEQLRLLAAFNIQSADFGV